MKTEIKHPFPPLYDADSRILILGSFPSVKSREQNFFYGHPQNRFWKIMANILDCPVPQTIEEKQHMLHANRIALWDSIAQCEIEGSSDASIEKVVPNDLSPIFQTAGIRQVFCNGKKSYDMYRLYIEPVTHRTAKCLPSTSPANAAWSLQRLCQAWAANILPFIQE